MYERGEGEYEYVPGIEADPAETSAGSAAPKRGLFGGRMGGGGTDGRLTSGRGPRRAGGGEAAGHSSGWPEEKRTGLHSLLFDKPIDEIFTEVNQLRAGEWGGGEEG